MNEKNQAASLDLINNLTPWSALNNTQPADHAA